MVNLFMSDPSCSDCSGMGDQAPHDSAMSTKDQQTRCVYFDYVTVINMFFIVVMIVFVVSIFLPIDIFCHYNTSYNMCMYILCTHTYEYIHVSRPVYSFMLCTLCSFPLWADVPGTRRLEHHRSSLMAKRW